MSMSATTNLQAPDYPIGAERAILVLTAIAASLLQLIDTSIVNVSLREIAGSIGATNTEIAWTVTSYAVSNVIMIPLSGMLGDLFGRKNYFTASILIFTIASVFCGTSNTLFSLILWRFIQGLGGGALLTTSQTIIVEAFPPAKVATANAIFGVGVILGPTFGPTLGGFLTDNYSWHWIFFINIPIGIAAAAMSWTFVKNRFGAKRPSKIDWTGIIFLIMAVGSLQYVLEEGVSEDWLASKKILIMTIVTAIGLAGFIYWEWTDPQPAVNIRLMKNRNMWLGSLLGFVIGMILLATVFVFPSFVQIGLGWTATMTGNFLISGALASAVSMVLVSRLLNRGVGPKLIMLIGAGMVFFFAAIMSFSSPGSTAANFFWPFILRGFGIGFMLSPMMSLSLQGLKGSDLGQGAGLSNMVRQLGGTIGIAVMNVILNTRNTFNYIYLSQGMNEYNQNFTDQLNGMTQNFMGMGYYKDQAQAMAYRLMNGSLQRQELLVSYDNIFWIVAIASLICVPVIFMIRSKKVEESGATEMFME
jgi:DHA2 family multidrug resistance protein